MAVKTSRKSRTPVIFLVIVILLGGTAFGVGAHLQYKQIQLVNAAIAHMPESWGFTVGEFGGSFFGDVVTLKRVSLTLPSEDGPVGVTMSGVAIKGVNAKAASGTGVTRIVERMAIGNLKLSGDGFENTVEHLSITGIRGDIPALVGQIGAGLKNLDPAAECPAVFDLAVDKALMRNLRFSLTNNDDPVTVTAASAEAVSFSLLKSGPLTAKDIRIEKKGATVAGIEQVGIDGWMLPRFDNLKDPRKIGLNLPLGQNPFGEDTSFTGIHGTGIRVEIPLPDGTTSPLTVGSSRSSFHFAAEKQSIHSKTDAVVMEKKLLSSLLGPSLEDVAPLLPETFAVSAELAMDLVPVDAETVTIVMRPLALAVKDLGSITVALAMAKNPMPLSKDTVLHSFDATVADEGASERIFAFLGKKTGKTAAEARRDALISLGVSSVAAQGSLRDLCTNTLSFLEKPGATLSMKLELGKDVDTETLAFTLLTDPDSVGLTSSVSRADR